MVDDGDFRVFINDRFSDLDLVDLNPDLGEYFGSKTGVLVVKAPSDSTIPLKAGDVILKIDGREPKSVLPGRTDPEVLRFRRNGQARSDAEAEAHHRELGRSGAESQRMGLARPRRPASRGSHRTILDPYLVPALVVTLKTIGLFSTMEPAGRTAVAVSALTPATVPVVHPPTVASPLALVT
jgi:hypothetical protein